MTPENEFDAIYARLVLQLERGVAVVTVITAVVVLALLLAAHFGGAIVGAVVTWAAVAFALFYFVEIALLHVGWYTAPMRFVATFADVTIASVIIVLGVEERGVVFALTGGGPFLYLLAVSVSTLRLSPVLCVVSGALGTLQFVLVSLLVVIPATTPAEAALMASPGYVVAIKAVLIMAGGVFGALATNSMRRLLRRLTWSAVERDRARGLFGQSASEAIVSQLLASGEENREQSMTIVSLEIRNFSLVAQKQAPNDVVRTLNAFFEKMNQIVVAHGGVVNKVFGSSMLAVFLPPPISGSGSKDSATGDVTRTTDGRDAAAALAAAREMVASAAALGLKVGVGVHRGEAVVGSIGVDRQELAFVGETVTLAVGVQELTRRLGGGVLWTQSVRDALASDGAATAESAGWFEVRGSESLVEIYRGSQ